MSSSLSSLLPVEKLQSIAQFDSTGNCRSGEECQRNWWKMRQKQKLIFCNKSIIQASSSFRHWIGSSLMFSKLTLPLNMKNKGKDRWANNVVRRQENIQRSRRWTTKTTDWKINCFIENFVFVVFKFTFTVSITPNVSSSTSSPFRSFCSGKLHDTKKNKVKTIVFHSFSFYLLRKTYAKWEIYQAFGDASWRIECCFRIQLEASCACFYQIHSCINFEIAFWVRFCFSLAITTGKNRMKNRQLAEDAKERLHTQKRFFLGLNAFCTWNEWKIDGKRCQRQPSKRGRRKEQMATGRRTNWKLRDDSENRVWRLLNLLKSSKKRIKWSKR